MGAQWNPGECAPQTERLGPQNSKLDTSKNRCYLIGKEIGHGTFATVHLAEYLNNIFKKKVRLACKIKY
jgi:serine kinase